MVLLSLGCLSCSRVSWLALNCLVRGSCHLHSSYLRFLVASKVEIQLATLLTTTPISSDLASHTKTSGNCTECRYVSLAIRYLRGRYCTNWCLAVSRPNSRFYLIGHRSCTFHRRGFSLFKLGFCWVSMVELHTLWSSGLWIKVASLSHGQAGTLVSKVFAKLWFCQERFRVVSKLWGATWSRLSSVAKVEGFVLCCYIDLELLRDLF